MSVRVRPGQPADAVRVASLDRDCFGPEAWSPASWQDEFGRIGVDRVVLVADSGRLAGYLVLIVPPEGPVDLTRIGVHPAVRRTGVGGALMAAALEAVAGRPVMLEVAESNEVAMELYRRFGFAEISRRPGYYPGRVDAVVMRRD
jgi:[ribosomal protein S18]-alanine N-acetyltransferase